MVERPQHVAEGLAPIRNEILLALHICLYDAVSVGVFYNRNKIESSMVYYGKRKANLSGRGGWEKLIIFFEGLQKNVVRTEQRFYVATHALVIILVNV